MSDTIKTLAEVEKDHILETLTRLNGDKMKAARVLNIGKTTLYRKLDEWGVPQDYGCPNRMKLTIPTT